MGAVTYPDATTAAMVNEYFVPVQIDVTESADLVEKFSVVWTPNINVLTAEEKMIYRVEGWLPPHEFTAMLMLACGHFFLKQKNFKEAASFYKEMRNKLPTSLYAPEALYFLGVCRYLESGDVEKLKKEWMKLQSFYSGSVWAVSSDIL
jgi:thioredoxin-related protein